MGKFFEAMQRAAQATSRSAAEAPERPVEQPELDASLLEPEATGDAGQGGEAASLENPDSPSESPSAVIRLLESEVHQARRWASPRPRPLRPPPVSDSPLMDVSAPSESAIQIVKPLQGALEGATRWPQPTFHDPDPSGVRVHPAYDRIVQRLLGYRRAPRQSVVLVASAVAQEGTSTVARNLATALSHSGTEQVLLVDANFRAPSQHGAFGVDRSTGLGDVLKGDVSLTSVLHSGVGNGISLITCGGPVKSPTQLLTAAGIQGVMMALLSLFDWIIVDSPPITAYPDVASLASASGAAILVIRAESTRSEVVDEAKKTLEGTGVDLLGAVLNRRRFHIPNAIYRRL